MVQSLLNLAARIAVTAFPFEDVLDSLLTGVVRVDADQRITFLNPAAADLLETSPRHALGRRLIELLPLDEALAALVTRALGRREPLWVPELALTCGAPPGRRRSVSCDMQPVDGGVQLELQALDRRLLPFEATGLQQNLAAQRLLFQALAHEIKNPLSGMRGAAQLLAADSADNAQREYLDVMLREIDRLRDLVDALLGPARAPRMETVNVHAILEHVRELLGSIADNDVSLLRDYDPSLPELHADPDQLTQVFLNLANNAIDALSAAQDRDSPRLILRTRVERNALLQGRRQRVAIRVDVEDNGAGVPDELRGSLFLPLITGRAEGTGLGLPIARDIVHRHGGSVEWRSDPGRTVFSVILPVNVKMEVSA